MDFAFHEDMYQLIDHIFYDGRHLFQIGEQALRLREKHLGRTRVSMLPCRCHKAPEAAACETPWLYRQTLSFVVQLADFQPRKTDVASLH